MKKLIIICEGQSELKFCDKVLKPHFDGINIEIEYPLIAHSNGGIVPWKHLKNEIGLHYATDRDRFITTFIDYYGLLDGHYFPGWVAAKAIADKATRLTDLERGMLADVDAAVRPKFIPNILLHEFETLMLADPTAFARFYDPSEFDDAALTALCAAPPETINDGVATAPSKRLKQHIPAYDKANDGPELGVLAGLPTMRHRCPRFDAWITKLENI